MKVRDSGMPPKDYWETLLDLPGILQAFDLGPGTGDVVELGCGYGTVTLPLARCGERQVSWPFGHDIRRFQIGHGIRRCHSWLQRVTEILWGAENRRFGFGIYIRVPVGSPRRAVDRT